MDNIDNEIVYKYINGLSQAKLAKEYGENKNSIKNRIKKLGFSKKNNGTWDGSEYNKWSILETKYGFSETEVKNKVKSENLKGELLYHRILMATDYISGMTDSYATNLYKVISGDI